MANPDIVDVATINAESVAFTLTATTTTTLLTVSDDVVLKVNPPSEDFINPYE